MAALAAQQVWDHPRLAPTIILAASAAILGTALAFQYFGGLQPCQLCLYQRIPYLVGGSLALLSLAAAGFIGRRAVSAATIITSLAFSAGIALAVFHVGVEQHWWAGLSSCGGTIDPSLSFEDLKAQLLAAPVVRCDEVTWSLLGISMAGYNALISLALAGFGLWAAVTLWRGPASATRPTAGGGGR